MSSSLHLIPFPDPPVPGPTFVEVYRAERTYVWHTLRRLGARAAEIEDLAHDVFVVVHRRLSDYDADRPLRPWLFGICFRVLSERRRRAPPEWPVAESHDQIDSAPDPEALVAQGQARALVAQALGCLPLEQRAVLVMHDIDGASAPEIATTLGTPLNTVYSRLRLGRASFAAAVAKRRVGVGGGL